MTIFPFILDSRPAWLRSDASLLLAPHGTGTLLEWIASCVADRIQEPITVLAAFPPDDAFQQAIRRSHASVQTIAPVEQLLHLLAGLEPSDWVLLIDARRCPARRIDLRPLLSRRPDAPSAVHLVSLAASEQGTREYVQFDPAGRVTRIQRYYEGLTWLQAAAVFCTIAPAACLRLLERPALGSLLDVRGSLAACGVPSRDLLLTGGIFDLHEPRHLLRLTEQGILQLRRLPTGYKLVGRDVWAASTSRIDPAARLHGPLVLQEYVSVEAGATVIGPALLGPAAVVGHGATVAQCLLMPRAAVSARATVCHQVVSGRLSDDPLTTALTAGVTVASTWTAYSPCAADPARSGPPRRTYTLVKQIIDRTFALLALVLLAPPLLLIAALVKLGSRGPVLFGHEREGKGGRVFRCWKFRTMKQGAHAQQRALYANSAVDGPQFKIDNDPRVTRSGWLLRKTNIDELPQLFNVLAGQMSLIGPRPSPFRENQICIPWRQARLSVRPGITGLWQICRSSRALGDFHQWIFYDMLYVRHMSAWLDLKILVGTLVTFGGRWGVPLSWMLPARKRYDQSRPWVLPDLAAESAEGPALAAPRSEP